MGVIHESITSCCCHVFDVALAFLFAVLGHADQRLHSSRNASDFVQQTGDPTSSLLQGPVTKLLHLIQEQITAFTDNDANQARSSTHIATGVIADLLGLGDLQTLRSSCFDEARDKASKAVSCFDGLGCRRLDGQLGLGSGLLNQTSQREDEL